MIIAITAIVIVIVIIIAIMINAAKVKAEVKAKAPSTFTSKLASSLLNSIPQNMQLVHILLIEKFKDLNTIFNSRNHQGKLLVELLRKSQTGGAIIADTMSDETANSIVNNLLDKHENLIRIIYPKIR